MDFFKFAIPIFFFTCLGIMSVMVGGAITVWMKAFRHHTVGTFKHLFLYFLTLVFAPLLMLLGFFAIVAIWLLNIISKKKVGVVDLKEMSNQIVTIFVHGTFEPDAVWTREEHPLRSAIQSKFSKKNVNFERFIWSGANLISERTKAARNLREMIEHYQQRGCCVHVIAHSHGGAVVTSALTGLSAPHSIVFMATPFISIEHVEYPALTRRSLGFGLCTATAFLFSLLPYILDFSTLQQSAVIFSIVFATLTAISIYFFKPAQPGEGGEANQTQLQGGLLTHSNTRIYISNGDEAGAILQFSSLLSSVFRSLISKLFDAAEALDETVSGVGTKDRNNNFNILHVLGFSIFAATIAAFLQNILGQNLDSWFSIFYCLLISILSGFLVSRMIAKGTVSDHISVYLIFHSSMTAVINATAKVAFGFGIKEAIAQHEIYATSSETPVGRWTVQKYASQSFKGLQHSRIYQDEETQENIAEFIRRRTPFQYH